jgi:asparagine synthetase B (glutamine-hydrolysing)
MTRLVVALALAASLLPSPVRAQVDVNIQLGLPAAPPLVVVRPGVQVVENWDEEVFFTGGWYWVRRDDRWWRARSPRATFVYVEPRRVPAAIYRLPPGHYRHWRKEEARAERHAWKEHEKAERRAAKVEREQEKRERHEEKHERHRQDHDHGR